MSLLDGYIPQQEEKKNSLLDGYNTQEKTERSSLLDGYNPKESDNKNSDNNVVLEKPSEDKPVVLEGSVSKNRKLYADRFPDRSKNFLGNFWSDTKDTVGGLAQLVGNTVNFGVLRPTTDLIKGEGLFTGKGREDLKSLWNALPALGEGLKENYGQKDVDMVNWERVKNGQLPINVDLFGLGQSFYAHPFNLLDFVGVGEVGKIGKVKNLTKGGELSKFSKTVGNKTLSPKYSKNLVYNAGQRLLETKPVQNIVNAIDKSPLRQTTDIAADFLGLSPDSRLMGTKGAEVRQAKLIEQANQTKNIAERNRAIAENRKALSGLSENEAKELIKSIESGKTLFKAEPREVINQKIKDFDFNSIKNDISVKGNELGENLSLKEIQKRARKEFTEKYQGHSVFNNELGDINYKYESKKKYTSNAGSDLKYKIIPKLNEIVESAKYIGTELPLEGKSNDFVRVHKLGNRVKVGGKDTDFLINVGEDAKGNLFYNIDDLVERPLSDYSPSQVAPNDIITNFSEISTPRMREVKNLLRNKVNQNAEYYLKEGLLSEETVNDLPVNTYAAIKNQKNIIDLTDAEKLDALNDIQKMPAEQRPFYVPRMFDDKLRASDFFANSTKRYKPNELKQRKVGFGDENKTGGKRIYDPVELANRLDVHRIKMINTEKMINEIIDNFAKPLDLSKEKVLDGYVPFNPDAFFKFYKKSIDLNETTIRKIQELDNVDTALKTSIEEAVKQLPDDIVEFLGAFKNTKIYQIPEDVAKTLSYGKTAKNPFEMMFDMGTAGFKRKVLGTSAKWFINNRIGNAIMAGLKGVNLQDYIKALNISEDLLPDALKTKSMYEAEKTIIGRTGGGNNTAFGNTMRLLGGEFLDTKDLKGLEKFKSQAANVLGVPGKVINTITDWLFSFNQKFEDWERRAAYVNKSNTIGRKMIKTTGQNIIKQEVLLKEIIKNPEVMETVLKEVENTLGDYINMTAAERRYLRKFVPFYSWYRTISRYTLSLPESNPFRADIASKLAMVSADKDDSIPDYQKGRVETELTSDITGKPLTLSYQHSIPFTTFGETFENPVGSINPYIPKLFEAASGKRFFMDRPFVSPNYENVYNGGYASLKNDNYGEYTRELPKGEQYSAFPIDVVRNTIPLEEFFERSVLGGMNNLIKNGNFRPYDALYDTSFGGYNYDEGFSKRPKGWSIPEQMLRYVFPLQEEKEVINKRVKTRRKAKD